MTHVSPPERRDQPVPDDFYRPHGLDELLAGRQPLGSIEEFLIEGLSDEEADAFLDAIRA